MDEKIKGKLILTSYEKVKYDRGGKKVDHHNVACFFADGRLEYVKVIPSEDILPAGTVLTGKVTNIVQNIPAAFVMLNTEKAMGFLSLKDLENAIVTNRKFNGKLQIGDEVLVKIMREPMKTKEFTLSSLLTMTARYAVVQNGCGRLLFSKKLSQAEKDTIFSYLLSKAVVGRDKQLIGMSDVDITIRTEVGKLIQKSDASTEKDSSKVYGEFGPLLQDIETSVSAIRQLISQASMRTCFTIHQKPTTWLQEVWHELAISGYVIEEYVTDDFALFQTLQELVQEGESQKLRFYRDTMVPLSALYSIQVRLDELLQPNVWLPCGGYLYIEPTEALIVVDVNSGKAIQKADTEEIFWQVNREAAFETARQLRLRNLSGMIIIDFINMKDKSHERELLEYMKKCTSKDYSKTTVYDITKLGLLEMTRNKKSRALHEIL